MGLVLDAVTIQERWKRVAPLMRGAFLAVALLSVAVSSSTAAGTDDLYRFAFVLYAAVSGFVLDWVLRILVAMRQSGLRGAITYLSLPMGIIDAACALAIPAALAVGLRAPELWSAGAIWVLKPLPGSPGVNHLWRALSQEAKALRGVGLLLSVVLVLSAMTLHLSEGRLGPPAFATSAGSFWWTLVALTTNSYPEGGMPNTIVGRGVATLVMGSSLAAFGLLAGILASSFSAESRRRDFLHAWDLVARVPFLQSLGPAAIAEVARVLRKLDVAENTVIIRYGRAADCMYLIADGEVQVKLADGGTRRLGQGEFFGEMAILAGTSTKRTATVTAVRQSTLLVLDVADFRMLAGRFPALAAAVQLAAADRRTGESSGV